MKPLIVLGLVGAGLYLYLRNTAAAAASAAGEVPPGPGGVVPVGTPVQTGAPASSSKTPSGDGTGGGGSATDVLTLADAASFPYSSAITAAQISAIHDQLIQELKSGQIPFIKGTSVLAYELGWGGAKVGDVKTTLGQTYKFDGTNWFATSVTGGGTAAYSALAQKVLAAAGGDKAQLSRDQWNYYWMQASGQHDYLPASSLGATGPIDFSQYMSARTGAHLGLGAVHTMRHTSPMNYRKVRVIR